MCIVAILTAICTGCNGGQKLDSGRAMNKELTSMGYYHVDVIEEVYRYTIQLESDVYQIYGRHYGCMHGLIARLLEVPRDQRRRFLAEEPHRIQVYIETDMYWIYETRTASEATINCSPIVLVPSTGSISIPFGMYEDIVPFGSVEEALAWAEELPTDSLVCQGKTTYSPVRDELLRPLSPENSEKFTAWVNANAVDR